MEVDERAVALAPLEVGDLVQREMTLHRANPASLRQNDRDRFFLDHRRPIDLAGRRLCRFQLGFPLIAKLLADGPEVAFEPCALAGRAFDQLCELIALLCQRLALL